ncbi:MAG TPA: SAM-dependent methyltransferase, partial [Azonexus sp.]|nr:SAM-dependent methyltransferase [Azonexus sp.]
MKNDDKLEAGKVWLIGAGPGDPDLLTVKAARLITQANVLVYDHLVSDRIMELARPDARRIYAGK